MDKLNISVLVKEPRGFTRILQIFFSALAWSTTASFVTISTLHIDCPDNPPFTVEYRIEYPFDLRETEAAAPFSCTDDTKVVPEKFPIDFSATAMLYILICFVSLLYASGAAIYYCLFTAKYETDPLAPMVDLCLTLLLTICWISTTLIWALNISDIKYYTHPNYFKKYLTVCEDSDANCQTANPGKWTSLTVTIACGFICSILWLGSTWFTFKETKLHKNKTEYTTSAGPTMTTPNQMQQ